VLLLLVLGVLPLQAWFSVGRPDVRVTNELDGLPRVTWVGTIRSDGDLAISITYDIRGDDLHEASIRLPSASRFLAANGEPTEADIGNYGAVEVSGPLTVTFERSGAVTRYDDGVVVDFAGLGEGGTDGDNTLFPCARCFAGVDGYGNAAIVGAVFADDVAGGRLALSGVDQLRTGDDDGALRFVGVLPGAADAGMVALLPVGAAPDAPTAASLAGLNAVPASARDAYDGLRRQAKDADVGTKEASDGPPIGRIATALILSAMWIGLVVWIVARIAAAKKALDADRPVAPVDRAPAFSPPSSLEPALVGVVVGDAGRGQRSVVAATLLALAHRGVIRLDGLDSERYTLTVPPGARGSTPTEEAVLSELRPQGQLTSTATFSGPPLWGKDSPQVAKRLAKVVAKEAHKARLVRVTLAATVLVPASLAIGIVALIGTGGGSWLAWVVTFAGPVLAAFAALLTGTNLTARGRAERAQWLQYGDWLRANSEMEHVGAPGIATWGEPLIYAAALGAAPTAAAALGVDR
jgi:hypothetical protein